MGKVLIIFSLNISTYISLKRLAIVVQDGIQAPVLSVTHLTDDRVIMHCALFLLVIYLKPKGQALAAVCLVSGQ
jgi:hypothetical protein